MKIQERSLFVLAREGRATLQIPTITINFGRDQKLEDLEPLIDLPDDYFVWLYSDRPVAPGRGFLFFSRRGYEAFKTELVSAFEKSGIDRGLGADGFTREAEKHFLRLATTAKKRVLAAERAIKRAKSELIKIQEIT